MQMLMMERFILTKYDYGNIVEISDKDRNKLLGVILKNFTDEIGIIADFKLL